MNTAFLERYCTAVHCICIQFLVYCLHFIYKLWHFLWCFVFFLYIHILNFIIFLLVFIKASGKPHLHCKETKWCLENWRLLIPANCSMKQNIVVGLICGPFSGVGYSLNELVSSSLLISCPPSILKSHQTYFTVLEAYSRRTSHVLGISCWQKRECLLM